MRGVLTFFIVTLVSLQAARADPIRCVPVNAGGLTPWAQNACALDHSKSPESWVRGWASFDPATTAFEVHINVETDSTTAGPCGTIVAVLRDAEGKSLAEARSDKEMCIGGKPPGKAVRYDWIRSQTVPDAVAKRAAKIDVSVTRTKNISSIWGIRLKEIAEGVKLVLTLMASG